MRRTLARKSASRDAEANPTRGFFGLPAKNRQVVYLRSRKMSPHVLAALIHQILGQRTAQALPDRR